MENEKQNTAQWYTGTYEQYLATQKAYGFYPLSREDFEQRKNEKKKKV